MWAVESSGFGLQLDYDKHKYAIFDVSADLNQFLNIITQFKINVSITIFKSGKHKFKLNRYIKILYPVLLVIFKGKLDT